MCGKCSKGLSVFSFGMAWGLSFAIIMAVIAWVAWQWNYGTAIVMQVSNVYVGYEASLQGGLWGALWGFVEGFIMAFLAAIFYNLFSRASRCYCKANGGSCSCGPECNCSCKK